MTDLAALALVGAGGSLGAVARFAVGEAVDGRRATLAVNAAGSLVLGAASALTGGGTPAALFVGAGVCGAFTTYSSFAVAVAEDVRGGAPRRGAAYAAATLVLAVAAAAAGAGLAGGL